MYCPPFSVHRAPNIDDFTRHTTIYAAAPHDAITIKSFIFGKLYAIFLLVNSHNHTVHTGNSHMLHAR